MDRTELIEEVGKVVRAHGNQRAAAAAMGVSEAAISQALRVPKAKHDGLRVRILETLGKVKIGPAWEKLGTMPEPEPESTAKPRRKKKEGDA